MWTYASLMGARLARAVLALPFLAAAVGAVYLIVETMR